jgi:hypothetical protein
MFDPAKNHQLALRLPENRKTALRVRQLMERAALADQNISPTEQALLDEVTVFPSEFGAVAQHFFSGPVE